MRSLPPGGARDLRAARRSSRSYVDDHRDGVPELGSRHPPRVGRGSSHRGDPPVDVEYVGVDQRERPRGGGSADALRRPRVRARQGDPRPRRVARRGGVPRSDRDRRSRAVVPRGRWLGDGEPRHRGARRGRRMARPRSGGRIGQSDPAACASHGELARHRRRSTWRRRRDASAPRARGRARRRGRRPCRSVRGTVGSGSGGREARPRAARSRAAPSSPNARRPRCSRSRRT